jgi:uncharacterized protein DUF4258
MDCRQVLFSGHALRRMFERALRAEDVLAALGSGEQIADYPDDQPFPSRLLLDFLDGRPIHVVVAVDADRGVCYVVTAYEPDLDLWEPDFRRRRAR